jgi:transcriptional regulator with XRE-family HTH domain
MAKEMNCSVGAVHKYVNDQVQEPSLKMIYLFSRYLDVDMEDLLLIEDNEPVDNDEE